MVIKRPANISLYSYLSLASIAFVIILVIVLFLEWRSFHLHTQELCELKEDYRNYIASIKKILHDYNRTKERLDLLESYLENEKKNENELEIAQELSATLVQGGVFAFSNEVTAQEDHFVLINRDLSYLQQGALSFLLTEYDREMVVHISDDEWLEYNDLLTKDTQHESRNYPSKKRLSRRCTRTVKKGTSGILFSDLQLSWPIERSKFWLSSLFGLRTKANGSSGFHYGLDMAAFRGTPVKAAAAGIVMEARYARGYGKTILIIHDRKYKTRYAHLNKICVSIGQKVKPGTIIGQVGSTGTVRTTGRDGSHLHFEVYSFNHRVNPLYFLAN